MVVPRLPVNADNSIMVKKIIAIGQLVADWSDEGRNSLNKV